MWMRVLKGKRVEDGLIAMKKKEDHEKDVYPHLLRYHERICKTTTPLVVSLFHIYVRLHICIWKESIK